MNHAHRLLISRHRRHRHDRHHHHRRRWDERWSWCWLDGVIAIVRYSSNLPRRRRRSSERARARKSNYSSHPAVVAPRRAHSRRPASVTPTTRRDLRLRADRSPDTHHDASGAL